MSLANTHTAYGSVTKTFHWLTALLILALFALGIVASEMADRIATEAGVAQSFIDRTAWLFSLHKTLGITLFAVALLRILWALSQPKPGLLNGDRWGESRLAETVHWLLYGSLVAVPLSGWVHHASSTGFAPIWWPLGQGLPLVPKSDAVYAVSGMVHYLLQWVLAGAIGLHVAGALKHHVIDRDATLRRMTPGHQDAEPTAEQPGHALPILAALAIWAVVLGGAGAAGLFEPKQTATAAPLAETTGDWQVETGTLGIEIVQMGSPVTGRFADWTAAITYDEGDTPGPRGDVEVTISIPSLTLGSVTDQAMGADYFAADTHPTATFAANIMRGDDGALTADGTLTIKGNSAPLTLPFDLAVEGDTATASGSVTVDRTDFGIGTGVDADSLAPQVTIRFDLTATRQE